MAYVEDGFFVLKIQDSLLGMLDAETDILKIEPGALKKVYIKRGLIGDRLVLEPRRAELLDAIPGEHTVAVELRVRRKYRQELEALVDAFDTLT